MQVPFGVTARGRRPMPRADEVGALLERVLALGDDLERRRRGLHQIEKPAAHERPASEKVSYASLIRFARGPFWLGSISKLTRSPPPTQPKLPADSRPLPCDDT